MQTTAPTLSDFPAYHGRKTAGRLESLYHFYVYYCDRFNLYGEVQTTSIMAKDAKQALIIIGLETGDKSVICADLVE